MPEAPVPDWRDEALAEAQPAMERAAAELHWFREQFASLRDNSQTLVEIVRLRDDLIAEQQRTIAALQVSLTMERSRRMRPKSERGRA